MKIGRESSPSVCVGLRSSWLFWSFVFCVVMSHVNANANQWCPELDNTLQDKLKEIDNNVKFHVQIGCLSTRRITNITLIKINNVTKVSFSLPSVAIYVNASWLFEWMIVPLSALVEESGCYSSTTSSIPKMTRSNAPIFSSYNTSETWIRKTVGLNDGFKVDPASGDLVIFSNASVAANITVNDIICVLKLCVWKSQNSTISINDTTLNTNLSTIMKFPIYNESDVLYDMEFRHNHSIPQRHVIRRSNTAVLVVVLLFFIIALFVAAILGYFYRSTLSHRLSGLINLQQFRRSDRNP
ncbi:m03 protein [Murid betaherpesvirus 1]|nr:m03 protein [Murid betaherpesvirus 1]